MGRDFERTDLESMLQAVERSSFARFTLSAEGVRLKADRAVAAPVDRVSDVAGETRPILAPRVGIFRAAPGSAAGAAIDAETEVGRIEAFRRSVPVTPGHAGRLAALLVADGAFVEYGQPVARFHALSPQVGS